MKTTVSQKKSERANVLLVSMIVTTIAGMTLASFLMLTAGQNTAVARSQNWNGSIPIVEAGIEEAMTHLNDNCAYSDISHPSTNWDADGWTPTDIGVQKTTTLPGGAYYTVEIVTVPPYSQFNPGVVSEGHLPALFGTTLVSPIPFLAQIGTQTQTTSGNTNVARKVLVQCGANAIFAKGLVAKQSIDMNGNNVSTDSFDSSDPAYSTGGVYDPTKHKANGDIATVSGLINSINVGNANINGSITTGPGGSVDIGANGTVGDLAWTSSHSGMEPGHFADDMNVYFPDVQPPFTGGYSTPTGGSATNAARNMATVTNTVTTWPAGQDPIITNTVTVTSTGFPTAGTYIGTPNMNTTITTTTTFPASGTYVGVVVTNTGNDTSSSFPASGSYIGSPVTNTSVTTSSTYPSSGTFVGLVTTNTTPTISSSYPSAGTYLGVVITNSTPASSGGFPNAGSYVGAVTTNCSSSVASDKNPPPAGTYCPSTPPWQTGSSKNNNSAWNWYPISGYSYGKITGYTSSQITSYTYSQVTGYSYQGVASYTYQLITGWTWAQIVSYTYYTYSTTTTAPTAAYYDFLLGSGNYKIGTLSGNVLITGNATLYVTDSINTDSITIAPGGSLKLYTSAPSVSMAGNGVWNEGGYATNFMYYGLPGNTDIKLAGNASFTGTIYAPEANLALNGGGNNTTDFIGASVTATATLNGHFNFHYDEELRKTGPISSFAIQSWNEIPLTQRY